MTSWFIGVKASVISGALLYSKSISYLFPVGKRQVLFAKRSYIYREVRVRTRAPATKKRPTGVDRYLFYGGPSGVQPAPQAAAAALSRLARCAGKRSRVYSAPRPFGFEPVPRQQKSDQPESIAFFSMVGRQGFEPWTLGLKVPCSAS